MEENYVEESNILFHKLQKRTITVIVLYVIMGVTQFFNQYQDFDLIFSSRFFRITLIASIVLTLFNLSLHFFKHRFEDRTTYKIIKSEKEIYELISIIPIFATIIVFLNTFIISAAQVEGTSMVPNYQEHDTVIISHFSNYERFDVVIIKVEDPNSDEYSYFIKRIIGLPGETIIIENNHIYKLENGVETEIIDTTTLPEGSYTTCDLIDGGDISERCMYVVPENSYFVLGDNRLRSNDSRGQLGFVSIEDLYGEVILKIDIFN